MVLYGKLWYCVVGKMVYCPCAVCCGRSLYSTESACRKALTAAHHPASCRARIAAAEAWLGAQDAGVLAYVNPKVGVVT